MPYGPGYCINRPLSSKSCPNFPAVLVFPTPGFSGAYLRFPARIYLHTPYGPGYCINRALLSKATRIFRRYWSFLDLVFPAHIWCFRQECTSIHRRFRRRSLPQHGIFRWQTCVFPFGLPSQPPTFPLSPHNLFPHHTGHFRPLHWILVYKARLLLS